MREIKFRAWGNTTKTMSPGAGRTMEEWIDACVSGGVVPTFVWLQFTGLRDKNGKEIYEGDVLLNHFHNQRLTVVWDEHIIGTQGGGWNYRKLQSDNDWIWKIDRDQIEVIGNIYENPELVENQPKEA
jgi:uncharacterized phage protein (TIGR01671 family)